MVTVQPNVLLHSHPSCFVHFMHTNDHQKGLDLLAVQGFPVSFASL